MAGRSWRLGAACAEVDPELWFPEKGDSAEVAKRICDGCPVRPKCLAFALEMNERTGVWGGVSGKERRGLRRLPLEIAIAITEPPAVGRDAA